MLHVANEGIMPIKEIECAIASYFDIDGTEIEVRGNDDGLDFLTGEIGTIFVDLVLKNPEEADRIANEEVSAVFRGKVRTGNSSKPGDRTDTFFVELVRGSCFGIGDIVAAP